MNKLIIALDNMNKSEVKNFIYELVSEKIDQNKIVFKVNDLLAEIWFEWISNILEELKTENIKLMIDWKWNDIPNTVCNYFDKLENSKLQNVEFLTIMASWWYEMMKKIVDRKKELNSKTKIFAVTILTSMNDKWAYEVFEDNVEYSILKLAKLALQAWVDWLVCSPNDTQILRETFDNYSFELMTPWIRLEENNVIWDDQNRINTPDLAIINWANHIVVWRPITQSKEKIKIINNILNLISTASYKKIIKSDSFENVLYNGSWEQILKYIWAIYIKTENWKYVRTTSKLLTNWYINVWVVERNFRIMQKGWEEISKQVLELWIKPNLIIWAQMWSVRFSSFLAKSLSIQESIYSEKEEIVENWLKIEMMKLKRHDIDLKWKKIILSEDVITKWSTITKMIEFIVLWWWEVVWISCIVNRTWKNNFEWLPIFSCYNPKPFEYYYDEITPTEQRLDYTSIPKWAIICEKPKNQWQELVNSMK